MFWDWSIFEELRSEVVFDVEFVELVVLEVLSELSIVTLPDEPLIVLFGSTIGTITGLGIGLYIDIYFNRLV